jgi:hypothetical protein
MRPVSASIWRTGMNSQNARRPRAASSEALVLA